MKVKFVKEDKVTWVCKRTNEVMEGVILNILTNSAIVEVTNIPHHQLDRYGLLNNRTAVNLKRLSKVASAT